MNYKRKKPRIHTHQPAQFPCGTPSYWNILFHTRPRRRREKKNCHQVLHGADADSMAWDLGNHKPHKYYW